MTIVKLQEVKNGINEDAMKGTLSIIDELRGKIASGQISSFVGVGISKDDETYLYLASFEKITVLRAMGAVAHLNNHIERLLDD